jgi:SAM-dependent methyltransferase
MMQLELERRSCPICGIHDRCRRFAPSNINLEVLDRFAFASRKMPEYMHWSLARCLQCDLVYADPAPRAEALATLYRQAEFDSRREARLASKTYGRLLRRIVPRLPERRGAVDVGTGDGAFLSELIATGFKEVVGIEPSTAPIEMAEPAIRSLIRHDVFRGDSFAPDSLTLITCFQTIEHMADPMGFCREARKALKPGGSLFLIGHNRCAFSAKLLGRRSPIFDVEHLQLFSPRSLRCLLEASGFLSIELMPVLNRYPANYWARLFPFPSRLKPLILRMLRSVPAGEWVISLPAGNVAAIAFK